MLVAIFILLYLVSAISFLASFAFLTSIIFSFLASIVFSFILLLILALLIFRLLVFLAVVRRTSATTSPTLGIGVVVTTTTIATLRATMPLEQHNQSYSTVEFYLRHANRLRRTRGRSWRRTWARTSGRTRGATWARTSRRTWGTSWSRSRRRTRRL